LSLVWSVLLDVSKWQGSERASMGRGRIAVVAGGLVELGHTAAWSCEMAHRRRRPVMNGPRECDSRTATNRFIDGRPTEVDSYVAC